MDEVLALEDVLAAIGQLEVLENNTGLYQLIYATTSGAVFASMLAYIAAKALGTLILSNYLFKATVALLDTGPFYFAVYRLRRYLRLAEGEYAAAEHARLV